MNVVKPVDKNALIANALAKRRKDFSLEYTKTFVEKSAEEQVNLGIAFMTVASRFNLDKFHAYKTKSLLNRGVTEEQAPESLKQWFSFLQVSALAVRAAFPTGSWKKILINCPPLGDLCVTIAEHYIKSDMLRSSLILGCFLDTDHFFSIYRPNKKFFDGWGFLYQIVIDGDRWVVVRRSKTHDILKDFLQNVLDEITKAKMDMSTDLDNKVRIMINSKLKTVNDAKRSEFAKTEGKKTTMEWIQSMLL